MIGGLGVWELLLILLIVLFFFGAKRLPEIGGSLGEGIREFKDSIQGLEEEEEPVDRIPPAEEGPEPGADGERSPRA